MYINITQDGFGRISRADSPADVEGLYTGGLESCIAVVLVGSEYISLFHFTCVTSLASLTKEIDLVKPTHIYLGINDKAFSQEGKKQAIQRDYNKIHRHVKLQTDAVIKGLRLNGNQGLSKIAITRNGECLVNDEVQGPQETAKNSDNHDIRCCINIVNNFFLSQGEAIAADLQYDGKQFTPLPHLNKSLDFAFKILQDMDSSYIQHGYHLILTYLLLHHGLIEDYVKYLQEKGVSILSHYIPSVTFFQGQRGWLDGVPIKSSELQSKLGSLEAIYQARMMLSNLNIHQLFAQNNITEELTKPFVHAQNKK